ncbi:hypothetical protein JCM18897A_47310 [Streptomyces sp. JCM 18897]
MWGKGSSRYRVRARRGESRAPRRVRRPPCGVRALTCELTVPTPAPPRDRKRNAAYGGREGAGAAPAPGARRCPGAGDDGGAGRGRGAGTARTVRYVTGLDRHLIREVGAR